MKHLKRETSTVRLYLDNFMENRVTASQTDARDIAENLEIDTTFPEKNNNQGVPV